jgi:hypothetical protein
MAVIKTSWWFKKLPADHVSIGISRGTRLGQTGYRTYKQLAPGSWFRSCASPQEFADRYFEILHGLNPKDVVVDLEELAAAGKCRLQTRRGAIACSYPSGSSRSLGLR